MCRMGGEEEGETKQVYITERYKFTSISNQLMHVLHAPSPSFCICLTYNLHRSKLQFFFPRRSKTAVEVIKLPPRMNLCAERLHCLLIVVIVMPTPRLLNPSPL
jgi:hypothetical protein